MSKKKIDIYADGISIKDKNKIDKLVDGYTFNPSIFRKLGVKDYLKFCKELSRKIKVKPLSLEVIADNEAEMIRQSLILSKLGKNIYVKIPITYTNSKSTIRVIKELVKRKVNLNITAIFNFNQVKRILKFIKNTQSILSVFSGRIFDTGKDASIIFNKIAMYVHKNSKCKVLWASSRMSYDIILAQKNKADIITLSKNLIYKQKLFNKNLSNYSLETVKQFNDDAIKSGYKF